MILLCQYGHVYPGNGGTLIASVDVLIEDAQRCVCECLGLDLCALWQWDTDRPALFVMTHLFRAQEGPPVPRQMVASEHQPWSLAQVVASRTIVLNSTEEAPPEELAQKAAQEALQAAEEGKDAGSGPQEDEAHKKKDEHGGAAGGSKPEAVEEDDEDEDDLDQDDEPEEESDN